MARFISESDESKYRMYKKAKKKINFVFNINCFMILVACVYVVVLFYLNSDSLRQKKREKEQERKEREQSTLFSHVRKSANPFILFYFLINFI